MPENQILKICKKCGSSYGVNTGFIYICKHHNFKSKWYKFPKDFSRLKGVVQIDTMPIKELSKHFPYA